MTGIEFSTIHKAEPIPVSSYSIHNIDSLLNINFFWFFISTQFFPKSQVEEQQLLDLRTLKKNGQNI